MNDKSNPLIRSNTTFFFFFDKILHFSLKLAYDYLFGTLFDSILIRSNCIN